MPSDRNNHELHPGDIVTLPCRVVTASENLQGCNLILEPVGGPEEDRLAFSANSKAVELDRRPFDSSWEK